MLLKGNQKGRIEISCHTSLQSYLDLCCSNVFFEIVYFNVKPYIMGYSYYSELHINFNVETYIEYHELQNQK